MSKVNENPERLDIPSSESLKTSELDATHTPGPWRVDHNARLEVVCTIEPYAGASWPQGIAHVYRGGKMNGTPYRMPAEANARLIAAAPALYAELVKMRDTFNDFILPLRIMRRGLMADACQIAKDSADAALALASKPVTNE